MKNVLIPTKLDSVAKEILEARGYTVVHDPDTPLSELVYQYPDTQALIVRSDKVTAEIIDALPKLRLVVRAGAGYNTIDTKYARRQGVDVMNTPGANSNAVAEEVLALALAHYRHVVRGDTGTRQGLWEKKALMGRELNGKVLGIVGLGNIGQLVARRSTGFDMELLGFDPVISASRAEDLGVELVSVEELFERADIISLHIPENDETRGMINRALLERMKDGTLLINCARAGVIDEDDLRAAKTERDIGFCNDVYPADEAGPKSVADIADVMLPHLGASTLEANYNAARRAAEQLMAYAEQGVTRYVVNTAAPAGMPEGYQELAYHIALVARHYMGASAPVRGIKCSFYGALGEYAKWFLPPICAAIGNDFDPLQEPEDAETYLSEKGITLEVRVTDESKRYGNSMTIDLLEGVDLVHRVSVRGTIAEGNLMISRINDFDKLYFEPRGNCLVVVYEDRPGMLAQITRACAEADINIEDIRAPHHPDALQSLAVILTNRPVPQSVVETIRSRISPEVAFALSIRD